MLAQATEPICEYATADQLYNSLVERLKGKESSDMTLSEIETLIRDGLRDLGRELTEIKMNEIGKLEAEALITGADGVCRNRKKKHDRKVETSFGEVLYERYGYGSEGVESLFPADGHLNLPPEKYTHEVRRLVAEDVTRSSYEEALDIMAKRTGAEVPKRQGMELSKRAAGDFEDFYEKRVESAAAAAAGDEGTNPSSSLLILTTDAKGVVMRHEGLRDQTKKAAEKEVHKLGKRMSRGEKRNRKRMAQVASVYTISPHVRTAEDVMGELKKKAGDGKSTQPPRPRPEDKRVWASVERGVEAVVGEMFDEAQSRDTRHEKQWVGLVDGNKTQLALLRKKAKALGVELTIIIDIIHVLEYVWKAAWAFYSEGNPEAEKFVTERLRRLLHGQSSQVAKGIRKMATDRGLTGSKRKQADTCANYLLKYGPYLHYDKYLAQGLPIATGVIEGACRSLVKDRMDITGARWNLDGAEAVLRLRSLRASGDFKEYWRHHEKQEQERNHISKYADGLPRLRHAHSSPTGKPKSHLRLVKG